MYMEERHQQISDLIRENGKISVAEIVEKYGISDESARRDLRMLEKKGLCKRTHGGAIRLQQVGFIGNTKERDYAAMPIFDNYREIARKAAELIRENDIIYLTSGSFGFIMLRFLPKDIRYTLVVNAADLAVQLRQWDNIDVFVVGGKMRQSGSIVDSMALDFVEKLHFDRCFLTGGGLTAGFGVSNRTAETVAFQRAVLKNSRKKTLLMPSSKVGADSFIRVCGAEEFDMIITDWDCLEEQAEQLRETGTEVIIVAEGNEP
ncbi:MAG: DeoR/GlpR transcriptional regulator [Oscillospiraceae bacterium]|nr:DeoR/GlpR transcriptional regulator [Oscillospiraceae bacterium]